MLSRLLLALALAGLPVLYLFYRRPLSRPPAPSTQTVTEDNQSSLKTVMQAPRDDLDPPKNDPFSQRDLAQYDGSDDTKPIYVSIKGQ